MTFPEHRHRCARGTGLLSGVGLTCHGYHTGTDLLDFCGRQQVIPARHSLLFQQSAAHHRLESGGVADETRAAQIGNRGALGVAVAAGAVAPEQRNAGGMGVTPPSSRNARILLSLPRSAATLPGIQMFQPPPPLPARTAMYCVPLTV